MMQTTLPNVGNTMPGYVLEKAAKQKLKAS